MSSIVKHRRVWLLIGLCFALLFPLGSGVVEAKKDKAKSKCEGTKKQRKQKMAKRDITADSIFWFFPAEARRAPSARDFSRGGGP